MLMLDARRFARDGERGDLVLATSLGEAKGGVAMAAAVGVALSHARPSVLVAELGVSGRRGPTMLAAGAARELEDALRSDGLEPVAARGRVCWLGLASSEDALAELARALDALPEGGARRGASSRRPVAGGAGRADSDARRGAPAGRPSGRSLADRDDRDRAPRARHCRPGGLATARARRGTTGVAGLEAGGAASQRSARLARGIGGRRPAPENARCTGGSAR